MEGGRERTRGGKGGGKEERTETKGERKRQDSDRRMERGDIHQAVCVCMSAGTLIFLFLSGQNVLTRIER